MDWNDPPFSESEPPAASPQPTPPPDGMPLWVRHLEEARQEQRRVLERLHEAQ
ncbi:MAG: hypothetical protein HQL56_01910 [Magnetococcales bacterium]|nr:hypothetical protein [Magnetococcales bacterium]